MNEIRKTALVAYSAEQIFEIIEAAEHYPEFLPWCAGAVILKRDAQMVSARITIDYHGVRLNFATRNSKERRNLWPSGSSTARFATSRGNGTCGRWPPMPAVSNSGYATTFAGSATAKLAGPVLDRVANTLVDAFVARADSVYAEKSIAESRRAGDGALKRSPRS